jgi:LuxR family transcriptional regulator, maltose regulon positive regulatory protein
MQNRLDEAGDWLERGFGLATGGGYLEGIRCSAIGLARVRCAQGDPAKAVGILEQAAGALKGMQARLSEAEIAAALARAQTQAGELGPAGEWAGQFLGQPPALTVIPMENARLSAARVRLAQGRDGEALEMIEKVCAGAQAGGRTASWVEALILKARLLQGAQAAVTFQEVVRLAIPGGLTRLFLDEGASLGALVRACRDLPRGDAGVRAFLQDLLDGGLPGASEPEAGNAPQNSALVEPLSAREVEILKRVCLGWSNRQIAEELFISLPTVKKHTGNIFGKLGVTSRTQAIARARELGLD